MLIVALPWQRMFFSTKCGRILISAKIIHANGYASWTANNAGTWDKVGTFRNGIHTLYGIHNNNSNFNNNSNNELKTNVDGLFGNTCVERMFRHG